jgi:ecotin
MKTFLSYVCLTVALAALTSVGLAGDEKSHWEKAYPPAEAGMVRYVLHLPTLTNETEVKVELIVGKTVETDGANKYFFTGKIKEETVSGWGFPRYNVTIGPMASTMMAPAPGTPKVAKFVTLGGEPYLIRYNSKLPVVVYAPEGIEVRYRLWKGEPESQPVDKG